jgi:hypothetical protein
MTLEEIVSKVMAQLPPGVPEPLIILQMFECAEMNPAQAAEMAVLYHAEPVAIVTTAGHVLAYRTPQVLQ